MSGVVVRWWAHEMAIQPAVSASRDGVMVTVFLHEVPQNILDKANEVWEALRQGGHAPWVHNLATHRTRKGRFEPIGQVFSDD